MPITIRTFIALSLALGSCAAGDGTYPSPPTGEVSVITLERRPLGRPAYRLTFRGDGSAARVVFGAAREGTSDQRMVGTAGREAFARIAALLLSEGFFALEDVYRNPALQDGESVTVAAAGGSASKSVLENNRSGPPRLQKIQNAIDDLGAKLVWAAEEEKP